MTRRAVQAAAFELGAPDEGMLFGQIDWLAANGKLTPDLRDLAHELRVFGKEGAHPAHDGLSDVTEEDADAALDFLEHFLNYVFVLPGGVAARRAERQKGA
jgi:hypothetical protein